MSYRNISAICLTVIIGFMPLMGQVFTEQTTPAAPVSGSAAAGTATISNGWSVLLNPAGLSRLEGAEVFSGYHKPWGVSGLAYTVAGAALPVSEKIGVLALSYESYGAKYSGTKLSSESVYRFSHAVFLQKDIHSTLALGYSLNLYQLDYGQSAGSAGDGSNGIDLGSGFGFGLDLGLQASLRQRTWIGVYGKNINSPKMGSSLSSVALPRALAIGFGFEPYYGIQTNFAISQSFNNKEIQYRGGLDYAVTDWFTLRAGINTQPNTFTLGGGLNRWGLKIDYAYIHHPVLAATSQFSFGYSFKH